MLRQAREFDQALNCFGDIFRQNNDPPFRDLKVKTMTLAVDCWLGGQNWKYEDANLEIEALLDSATPDETRRPDWLFLRLSLARAYQAKADALDDPQSKLAARDKAGELAGFVSEYASEHQDAALEFLRTLQRGEPNSGPQAKSKM